MELTPERFQTVRMSELDQTKETIKEDKRFIEELDVVKKGYLHIKRPPTNIKLRIKTWQKRYLVLRDNTIERGSRLEICSSQESWTDRSKKSCDKYVLDLRSSCSIVEYKKSKSFPFSFSLTRKGHASLILGAETEHELKQWMCAINLLTSKGPFRYHHNSTNSIFRDSINGNMSHKSNNSLTQDPRRLLHQCGGSLDLPSYDCPYTLDKWIIQNKGSRKSSAPTNMEFAPKEGCLQLPSGFSVSIYRTTSRNEHSLSGEMFLEVTSSYVILHQLEKETRQVMQWPLVHIRKFKCEDRQRPAQDLLTLEASCHCECGGGTYQFQTVHGRELVLLVRDAMRKLSLKRREQEEKLQEMRAMRKLRLSMRTESDPCLQNKLRMKHQQSTDEEQDKRHSHEDLPTGEIPYYLTLLPDDYCSSTPDDTSSESDSELNCQYNRASQCYSAASSPDHIRSRNVSGLTTSSASFSDDIPPLPPPRPRHTFSSSMKPLPPLPN